MVVDDDVGLPRHFLDRLLFCAERFGFDLCQPAVTHASHSAWAVCRRGSGERSRAARAWSRSGR